MIVRGDSRGQLTGGEEGLDVSIAKHQERNWANRILPVSKTW